MQLQFPQVLKCWRVRRRGRGEKTHAEEKKYHIILGLCTSGLVAVWGADVIVWLFSCLCTPRLQGIVIAQLDKELIKTDWKFLLCFKCFSAFLVIMVTI